MKKWPKQIKHRNRVLAKIYRPGKGRNSYRVAWQVAGQRLMKSFATYSGEHGARKFAEDLVPSLAKGSPATLLTPKQAQDAFHIQDMLIAFQQESGRHISPVEAVSAFISAIKLLPADASLVEAARLYARVLGSVKPKTIVDAVADFIQARKGKEAKPGERARFRFRVVFNVYSFCFVEFYFKRVVQIAALNKKMAVFANSFRPSTWPACRKCACKFDPPNFPMCRDIVEPFNAGRLHGDFRVQAFGDGVGDDGLALFFQQFNQPLLFLY